jgi:hypothetical protein
MAWYSGVTRSGPQASGRAPAERAPPSRAMEVGLNTLMARINV